MTAKPIVATPVAMAAWRCPNPQCRGLNYTSESHFVGVTPVPVLGVMVLSADAKQLACQHCETISTVALSEGDGVDPETLPDPYDLLP